MALGVDWGISGYWRGFVDTDIEVVFIHPKRFMRKDKLLSKMAKSLAFYLSSLALPVLALGVFATPFITEAGITRLDKPGLWLSVVKWIQPKTGAEGVLTFRVYCPTSMIRDVTNGRWGDASKVSAMTGQGYPTGVVEMAYQQACK